MHGCVLTVRFFLHYGSLFTSPPLVMSAWIQVTTWFESKGWKEKWPLHYAAVSGNVPAIRQLTSVHGVDPNLRMADWNDSGPTQVAAYNGQLEAVVVLVQAGADAFAPKNAAGQSAKSDAIRKRHYDVTAFLEES